MFIPIALMIASLYMTTTIQINAGDCDIFWHTKNSDPEKLLNYIGSLNEPLKEINSLDDQKNSPLMIAIRSKYVGKVEVLLDSKADPNMQTRSMTLMITPLHQASEYGNQKIIQALINHGARINALDTNNVPPLMYAIRKNLKECVELLLELKADPSLLIPSTIGTHKDETMLSFASRFNYNDIVACLTPYSSESPK